MGFEPTKLDYESIERVSEARNCIILKNLSTHKNLQNHGVSHSNKLL